MILHMRLLLILSLGLGSTGCGDDSNPMAPDNDLVGTWRVTGSDMVQAFASALSDFLEEAGADQATVDAALADFQTEMEADGPLLEYEILRLKADGTWDDNSGGVGTWSVSGNILTFQDDGRNETLRQVYFVTGDELTLTWTRELMLELIEDDDDFTDEDLELFREMLDQDFTGRVFLRRD